jgi:hypothetical protein
MLYNESMLNGIPENLEDLIRDGHIAEAMHLVQKTLDDEQADLEQQGIGAGDIERLFCAVYGPWLVNMVINNTDNLTVEQLNHFLSFFLNIQLRHQETVIKLSPFTREGLVRALVGGLSDITKSEAGKKILPALFAHFEPTAVLEEMLRYLEKPEDLDIVIEFLSNPENNEKISLKDWHQLGCALLKHSALEAFNRLQSIRDFGKLPYYLEKHKEFLSGHSKENAKRLFSILMTQESTYLGENFFNQVLSILLERSDDKSLGSADQSLLIDILRFHGCATSNLKEMIFQLPSHQYLSFLEQLGDANIIDDKTIKNLSYEFLDSYGLTVFKELKSHFNANTDDMPDGLKEKLAVLEQLSENEISQLYILMMQLKTGFLNTKSNVALQAASLVVAAVHEDKESENSAKKDGYDYSPTLVPWQDFSDYLASISAMTPPLREHFIIAGLHWTSGEIRVKANGEIDLLLLDSIKQFTGDYQSLENEYCIDLKKLFPNQKINVYCASDRRQYDLNSCWIFSLDDIRRVIVLEERVLNKKKGQTIFDMLSESAVTQPSPHEDVKFYFSPLPASMLRTIQSRSLLQSQDSRLEQKAVKKGKETEKTVREQMREGFKIRDPLAADIEQNQRIQEKLEKMRGRVDRWIMRHLRGPKGPAEELQGLLALAALHTLPAWKARVGQADSASSNRSSPQLR